MIARIAHVLAVAVSLALAAHLPAQAQKRGGTLTYTYHPEPTAMSTIATTAVPVSLVASKIYESLLDEHDRSRHGSADPRRERRSH